MKAIKTTQQLKNLNPNLFMGAVDSIRQFGSLPNTFFSPTYNTGQRTDMYQTLSNAIHEADGFFDVVTPAFDEATQKLGAIFFDVDKFTYNVVNLTQAEIDANTQAQEDADQASQFFNQRKADGQIYLDRFNAYLYRRVINNTATKAQAIAALNFFYDALHPLTMGYFELAQTKVTALATGNADLIALKTKIINELTAYLANE